jgi:hypothetical protein
MKTINPVMPQNHFLSFPIVGSFFSHVECPIHEFVAHFCIFALKKYRLYSYVILKMQEACQLGRETKDYRGKGRGDFLGAPQNKKAFLTEGLFILCNTKGIEGRRYSMPALYGIFTA